MSLTSRLLPPNLSSNPAFNVPPSSPSSSSSSGTGGDAIDSNDAIDEDDSEDDERRFGRFPGMLPPVDVFPDRLDAPLEVQLAAVDYYPSASSVRAGEPPIARDGVHWMIRWRLQDLGGCAHFRMLHVLTERILLPPSHSPESSSSSTSSSTSRLPIYKDIYTNWGPMTKSQDASALAHTLAAPLGTLTLAERRALERLAAGERVREPDGRWNCQDWVKSVLARAVRAGLFKEGVVRAAVGVVSVSDYDYGLCFFF